MSAQRERIVRKAKDRVIDYSVSNFNKSTINLTSTVATTGTPTKRRNNARSYKPFGSTTTATTTTTNGVHAAEDEDLLAHQQEALNTSNEYETPPKKTNKTTRSRTTNKASTTTRPKNRTIRGGGGHVRTPFLLFIQIFVFSRVVLKLVLAMHLIGSSCQHHFK